ncbi:MAG TPA: metalloregulator ArsR/SmtB family transcription factor, partial [Chromatiales bacterium]|nr:metalloregulator ArsR/SmtB family transcription factor [Chromatiales bacterium]
MSQQNTPNAPEPSSQAKRALLEQFARVAKALAHPNRLELLEFLAQGERTVESLARAAGLSVANASQHLQQLKQAGLVASRRAGQHVRYRLADDDVVALMAALRGVARRHLAEVDRIVEAYLAARDTLEPVPAIDLLERIRRGEVTVLDVRPPEEYAAGHLPGAVNIPLEELERRLGELPRDREVVAYCRGPYCVLAWEAAGRLREKGIPARRLEGGLPEWRLA